jgi:hypothetical protein
MNQEIFVDTLERLESNFNPNDANHLKLLIFLFYCECTEITEEEYLLRLLKLVEKIDDKVIGATESPSKPVITNYFDFIPYRMRHLFN